MAYNDKFQSEYRHQIDKDLDKIIDVQNRILDFLIKLLFASNNVQHPENCQCFRVLLGKIRINIESINTIVPLLKKDFKFKISINLLYRCIVDDIINTLYLFSFLDPNDSKQTSLGNELNILHKEFLVSIIEGFTEKLNYDESLDIITNEQRVAIDEDIKNIINNTPNLINENGKGKQNSDIRNGTNNIFLTRIENIGNRGSFLSLNFKLKYIEKSNEEIKNQYKQLKYLFNYYTQYQHFNPETTKLIHKDLNHDIYNYVATIVEVLSVIEIILNVLNLNDSEHFKSQLKGMSEYISNSLAEISSLDYENN